MWQFTQYKKVLHGVFRSSFGGNWTILLSSLLKPHNALLQFDSGLFFVGMLCGVNKK